MKMVIKTLLLIIIVATLIFVGLSYSGMIPTDIQSYFITTVDIDIYTNNQLVVSDQVSSINYPNLRNGTIPIGELYGNDYGIFQKANCFINDKESECLYDNNTVVILNINNSFQFPKDYILVQLFYIVENEKPIVEPEVEYGTITLQIDTKYPALPYNNYVVSFIGDKGEYTLSNTYNFDDNGILIAQLDMSYKWIYYFEGGNYLINFDNNKHYYNTLTVEEISTTPDPLVINELPEEHNVYLYWEYVNDSTNTVINSNASFSAYAGELLDLDFYMRHPPGTALLEEDNDIILEINGEMYKLIAISKSGGNPNSNWPLINDAPIDEFPMINDDLMITFHYEKMQA